MRLIDWFKTKSKLIEENSKIRKAKNTIENELLLAQKQFNDISTKYITLLEEKSNNFDLYVKYQNQCSIMTTEIKELRKQLVESNTMRNSTEITNDELTKNLQKLERKLKRLEKQNEKSA